MSSDHSTAHVRIGTAGWAIPRAIAGEFPQDGSALARYSSVFDAAEINSTFKRSHQAKTYERWRYTVPADFRFSVKVPQSLSHLARLVGCDAGLGAFLAELSPLAPKLGPILLQLPPSFAFDAEIVGAFCTMLAHDGRFTIACEPRHASWFTAPTDRWLAEQRIARVAADPALHPKAGEPGGWRGLSYYRLHGFPRVYYSLYDDERLARLREQLVCDEAPEKWCIFDNTASGAAASNARSLQHALARK
jgi:uncharacterized protein YecE (DUF72 family)